MKRLLSLIFLAVLLWSGSFAQLNISIGSLNLNASDIGSQVTVPFVIDQSVTVTGMQFTVSFDETVLTPVSTSPVQVGITNISALTTVGNSWMSGALNGTINPNWQDNSFVGVNLPAGTTLFDLVFVYNGGASDLNLSTAIVLDQNWSYIQVSSTSGFIGMVQSNDLTLDIADINLNASNIGDTINLPVEVVYGASDIGSIQLEIEFDANVLTLVQQSATNYGVVNANAATTANAGSWVAGASTGSSIFCTWFDPIFSGITLADNSTLFELSFIYDGGSTTVDFVQANSMVFNSQYGSITTILENGGITGAVAPAAPMAYTNSASSISFSEAMLNGVAVANNSATTAYFEFGTDATYGDTIFADQNPVIDSIAVSAMVSNLQANTTYHYRLVCDNNLGSSTGNDVTFNTGAAPSVMTIEIDDFDASSYSAGDIINVPVFASVGYNGIGSMQFSFEYDNTVLSPVSQSATNVGLVNPLAATTASGGDWISGVTNSVINCNWLDPTYLGVNINSNDVLFELQFTYLGGNSDLNFGSANFVYDINFTELGVDFIDGSVNSSVTYTDELVITEIMYNPPEAGTDSLEFVEMYNNGATIINLAGYSFTDGVVGNFPAILLSPGEFLMFAVDSVAFENNFGIPAYQWISGALSNGGEELEISDASGNVVDFVDYDDSSPWPTTPDSYGPSLTFCDLSLDNSDGNNWTASNEATGVIINGTEIFATPGALCTPPVVYDFTLSIDDLSLTTNDIGNVINVPVIVDGGFNGIGSMQFEISYDPSVVTPVNQSATNVGLVNPAAATIATGGMWFSGNGTGNSIQCNWYDPIFSGINLTTGETLFELQFTYLGGSCDFEFNTSSSVVYDAAYTALMTELINGSISGTTAPSAPMAYTNTATSIDYCSAILNGVAVANNSITTAYFEYGTDVSYGDTIVVNQSPVSDSIAVSAQVLGLQANTEYHFRLVCENVLGSANGQDMIFTTGAAPAQFAVKVDNYNASGNSVNDTINVPVIAMITYNGIGSMQFNITYDDQILTPVQQSVNNVGIVYPLAAISATGGEWISGISNGEINCNWLDPTYAGVNINNNDTLFELQFVYAGGNSDLNFGSTNFVYDNMFNQLVVNYVNGSVYSQGVAYDFEISVSDMNLTSSDIGSIINVPVIMDMGYFGIGSMQFEITYDSTVVIPVMQSATNAGIANAHSATIANGGAWFAGNGSGNSIVANWYDPMFTGVNIASGETVFELQFEYIGGSSNLDFITSTCAVYDASLNLLNGMYNNGSIISTEIPAAPMAYTNAAGSISYNEATLNGLVIANNALTSVWFEYGTDMTYGNMIYADQNPINDSVAVTAMIQGLMANSTYHFRVVAENIIGTSYGQDFTFITTAAPAEMAIEISQFNATGSIGSIINIPVLVSQGYNGISSLQFSISYDSTVVIPVSQSASNIGIANPLNATIATGGDWISGVTGSTLNCNWLDPTYAGINITSGDVLFELQFEYLGGNSDILFEANNFVYNTNFDVVNVNYTDGIVYEISMANEDLFFSEYIEGSSNNKGLEIYNPTASVINLDDYVILSTVNGSDWIYTHNFPAGATISPSDVWVMVSNQMSATYFDTSLADEVLAYPELVYFNGDDARALAKIVFGDTIIIDVIGEAGYDPGSGWEVAGISNATKDHTLIRKPLISKGNTDWIASAGTDSNNSEWIVESQNYIDLGEFTSVDIALDIDDISLTSSQIGDTVNIPVTVINGYNGVGSMQFEISFDNTVLTPVVLSATNTGIVNPAAVTTATGGTWFAGSGNGSSISCNWFDPNFVGVDLASGLILFELQFVYLGGSSDLNFNTNNSFIYNPLYVPLNVEYSNGSVSGIVGGSPFATTLGSENISFESVTLKGSVDANNSLTSAWFEYGLTTTYTDSVLVSQSPINTSSLVDVNITGLLPNTTYYYRLVAENVFGISYGFDSTFATSAAPVDMVIEISEYDASNAVPGDTINVPVLVSDGYNGIGSMQFSVIFDPLILNPVYQSGTNLGIANPLAATLTGGSSWMSGVSNDSVLSCNWLDATFSGVNIPDSSVLFELQFVYNGSSSDIYFNESSCYVYNTLFDELVVDYINGEVSGSDYQAISLSAGWSIWSTYINPINANIADIFVNIATEVILIKDGNGMVYWPQYFINAIGDIEIGEAYQIKMLSNQILNIYGVVLVPELTAINIPDNWSLLGYLRNNPGNIASMLSSIASDVVIVKNGTGSVYWPQFNINMIGNMNPGEGYQIKMTVPSTLYYPANSAILKSENVHSNKTSFYPQPTNTGNNMTVCIPAEIWNANLPLGSEISVKDASGRIVGASSISEDNTAITVWGNDELTAENDGLAIGSVLEFFVWNSETNNEYEIKINQWIEGSGLYEENGISIAEKAEIISADEFSLSAYPNPCKSYTSLHLNLISESNIKIYLLDELGREMNSVYNEHLPAGNQNVIFNTEDLSAGNYQIRVETVSFSKTVTIVRVP